MKESAKDIHIPELTFEQEQEIFESEQMKKLLDKKILAVIRLFQQSNRLVWSTTSLRDVRIKMNHNSPLQNLQDYETVAEEELNGVDPLLLRAVLSILAMAESTKDLMKDPQLFEFAQESAVRELKIHLVTKRIK